MSYRSRDLSLHEEVLLLALRDRKGTVESRAGMYRFALGGALLAELLLESRIAVGSGKQKLVEVADPGPLHDPLLDECLEKIAAAKRRGSASTWISRFSNMRRLRHRVAEGLCRKGVLKNTEDQVLIFFTRKLYPTIDPAPERALLARIRRAITSSSRRIEPRTGILIALAHATGLLRVHFDRAELKARKARLESIKKGELIGAAAGEAVRAAQAAAMAAISAATVTTVIAHHH